MRGGLGTALSGPADQNVYVGFRNGGGDWQALPFFEASQSADSGYTGEDQELPKGQGVQRRTLREGEFDRVLGNASDRWTAGPFSFVVYSPFGKVSPPTEWSPTEARNALLPAVYALLEYRNETVEPAQLMFGLGTSGDPQRPLNDQAPDLAGFAMGNRLGYATAAAPNVRMVQAFNVFDPVYFDESGLHRLGPESALIVDVAPGQSVSVPIALGFFEDGEATSGIRARYAYAESFCCLEDVLREALERAPEKIALAVAADSYGEGLTSDQRFLLAHSVHSYYPSTELLKEKGGGYVWVVNEGEYRMMNTFDLTVDHLFFELEFHPWAVRDVLDLFVDRYSYHDTLHDPAGNSAPGGLSFTHDMGVANQFSPMTRSSYECVGLTGCFSQMTIEELLNWVVCASVYGLKTDDLPWLRSKLATLEACMQSLLAREHPDPEKRNGLFQWDSDRCGPHGAEITTYDSLDVSLGQTRNNLYMAVKAYGAWLSLGEAFHRIGREAEAKLCIEAANRVSRTVLSKAEPDGLFAAVFEGGNASRIIPAIEGLAYPLYLGLPMDSELVSALGRHLAGVLKSGVCLDSVSGGWKLSSTSKNTWYSKIALCQWVASRLYGDLLPEVAKAPADAAHRAWMEGPCGPWAYCDQIASDTGVPMGSKYYPRGVTAWLWV